MRLQDGAAHIGPDESEGGGGSHILDKNQREGLDILDLCLDSEVSIDPLSAQLEVSYSRGSRKSWMC